VNGFADPPTVTNGHGIASVGHFLNVYCVFLDPSIDVGKVAAVATPQFSFDVLEVVAGGCQQGSQVGVQVRAVNPGTGVSESGDFSIAVFGG
jgi:hypothetical protein